MALCLCVFSLAQAQSIRIIAPNGGQNWVIGEQRYITWTASGLPAGTKINLYLFYGYTQKGVIATNIDAGPGGTVGWSWVVGRFQNGQVETPASGAGYAVRIRTADGRYQDQGDSGFSIAPAAGGATGLQTTQPKVEAAQPKVQPQVQQGQQTGAVPGLQAAATSDLEIADLEFVWSNMRLKFHVRNNGPQPFRGNAEVRYVAMYSLGGGFTADRTVTLSGLSINPGQTVLQQIHFQWPNPITYPQLTFGMVIDPNKKIAEINENNNYIERNLRAPCGAQINTVSKSAVNPGETIEMQGIFGQQKGPRGVIIVRNNQPVYLAVVSWANHTLRATVPPNVPVGQYQLMVECTARSGGVGYYTSNVKPLTVAASGGGGGDGSPSQPPNCTQIRNIEGYTYRGKPVCISGTYQADSHLAHCDAQGYYCCYMSGGNSQRCGNGKTVGEPRCCDVSEMSCRKVLMQPWGCYERR